MTVAGRRKLMQEIIEEQLAYHSSSLPFGEKARLNQKLREKMNKLNSKERQSIGEEIKRIKFLRVKDLFESFYR